MPMINTRAARRFHGASGNAGSGRVARTLCVLALACGCRSTPDTTQGREMREQFTAASTRWASRRLSGYRFVLAGRYAQRLCEVDIVVGRRTYFLRNSCGLSQSAAIPTMTDLFHAVDTAITAQERCRRERCGCPSRTHVEYDPVLGYPRRLRVELDTTSAPAHPVSEQCREQGASPDDWIVPVFQDSVPGPAF